MALCSFVRISETTIRCSACGVERTHLGDPAKYRRPCSARDPDDAAAGRKSRGLGDTIAKLTHATGIAQAVEAVSKATGVPCGCKGRQEWLNKVVPYESREEKPNN
jgi:hypothetical protein